MKRMKRMKRILVGILCMMMAVTGCQGTSSGKNTTKKDNANSENNATKENQGDSRLDVLQPRAYGNIQGLTLEPGSTISLIGRGKKSAYWSAVKEGAQKAVDELNEELGYKGSDKIVLSYSAPASETNVDEEVNILDEELDRYPAAVGIALIDATSSAVQFDLAAENGVPIVTFDSGTDYKDVVCTVDTDNEEAGKTAADKLCDMINDEGEVLAFVQDSTSTSAAEREKGFTEAIESGHSNVSVANVYHMDDLESIKRQIAAERSNSDAESEEITTMAEALTDKDVITYLLEKHANVRGIYTTSESVAEAVIEGMDGMGHADEYKLISFDGGKTQLERLTSGKISGLIVQNPYGIGYATVVACVRAVMGEGNEAVVDAGFTWVTEKNMNEEAIQNMMY